MLKINFNLRDAKAQKETPLNVVLRYRNQKLVYPSGDIKKDMKEIMAFYKGITPHTPQNFSVDVDYDA